MHRSLWRITSLLLLVALLFPAWLQPGPVAASHQSLWWNEDGRSFASYGGNAQIVIYQGQMDYVDSCNSDEGGVDDYIYPYTDIYIVRSGTATAGAKLTDVAGIPNTVQGFGGGLFIAESIGVTAPGGAIGTGTYAVVYDECQNGKVDPEDKVFDPAIEVTIPTIVPPLPASITAVKQSARKEADFWKAILGTMVAYFAFAELQEKLGCAADPIDCFLGTESLLGYYLDWLKAKAGIKADPEEMMLATVANTGKHYAGIANDPPDPQFRQPTTLAPLARPVPDSDDPVRQASVGDLGGSVATEAALAEALLHALERYQGAALEEDGEWALIQARASRDYSTLLALQLVQTNAALAELDSAIAGDPRDLDPLVAIHQDRRSRIATTGFTSDETRLLRNLGLGDGEIAALRADIVAQDYAGFAKGATRTAIADLIAANTVAIGHYDALAVDMGTIVAGLEADPNPHKRAPIARAGGPYTATEEAVLVLDGTASSDPDGTIVAWNWDLDGDGEFDDATSAGPSFAFPRDFAGTIGLRVTDNAGRIGVGYARVTITDANAPPIITGATPSNPLPAMEVGGTLAFSVAADDPDGDALTIAWTVDDAPSGFGTTFAFQPSVSAAAGMRVVRATITDGHEENNAVREWGVSVLLPDGDGDGWRANADCGDADPSVHPGQPEIFGNGKDDDCNPATTDAGAAPSAAFVSQSSGRNVAMLEGGATVVAVSSQNSPTYAPQEMLDYPANDNPWLTANGQVSNQWVTLQLAGGKSYLIDRVRLMPDPDRPAERVRDFAIDVSTTTADDAAFTTVLTATAADDGELQEFALPEPVQAKYVRYRPLNNRGSTVRIATRQLKIVTSEEGGAAVTFRDHSTDPDQNIAAWHWDFGDGATGTAQNPAHTYAAPGTYTVALTVTDAVGNTSTATRTQRVLAQPVASFTMTPAIPKEGQTASFRSTSTAAGGIIWATWDWGDGSNPTAGLPGANTSYSHAFPDNQPYTMTLEVADAQEQVARVQQVVTPTNAPPTATFRVPQLVSPGGTVQIGLPSATDVSTADRQAGFTYAFDCGAGYGTPAASNTASCPATGAVTFTVKGKVIDKDGGATEYADVVTAATIVLATPSPVAPGTTAILNAKVADIAGRSLPGVRLNLEGTGDNTIGGGGITDSAGVATLRYVGQYSGLDTVVARESDGRVPSEWPFSTSDPVTVTWTSDADVLILNTTVRGGQNSLEAQRARALGYTVAVIGPNGWRAKTTADFMRYKALILGDPDSNQIANLQAALDTRDVWGPAVTGNVVIVGSDPTGHAVLAGAIIVVERSIAFAAADAGHTGIYIAFSQYYDNVPVGTPVPLLDAFEPGGFSLRGVGCYNKAHIVATHPALAGMTDVSLSNWSCSAHVGFDRWPDEFLVLAIAEGIEAYYTAHDGRQGIPYIVARGRDLRAISAITLAPEMATATVGAAHTVTATVQEDGTPTLGRTVAFTVTAGPHAGRTATAVTDANGAATFSYTGTGEGTDTIGATFMDGTGATQTAPPVAATWQPAANGAPTVQAGPHQAVDEGAVVTLVATFADPDTASGHAATIDWGDGSPPQVGTVGGTGAAGSVTGSHTYADNGTYTVTVTVVDGQGGSGAGTLVVTVGNVAPQVGAGPDVSLTAGETFAGSGTFADPGADTWTATVDYGDGSGVQPLALAADKTFSLSHPYATPGTYTVAVAVTDDEGGRGTGTLTVTVRAAERAATLTVDPAGGTYGDSATLSATLVADGAPVAGADVAFTLDGVAVGSATTDPGGVATLAGVSLAGVSAGSYLGAIRADFADLPPYTAATATGPLTVAPAPLAVIPADTSRAYGADNPAFTVDYRGFVGGDGPAVLTGTLTCATTATAASTVAGGPYPITCAASTLAAPNYVISYAEGLLTITPAALTVTAHDASRAYGQPNPNFTGTLAGVVNGDAITATYRTTADSASPPGTYPIVPTLVVPGGALGNYAVTSVDGTLTIAPPSATATTVTDATATYGDEGVVIRATVTAATVVADGTVTFVVADGAATIGTVTGAVTNGTASASFPLGNVGAGTYTIGASFAHASLPPSQGSGVLTVHKAATALTLELPHFYGQPMMWSVQRR